MMDALKFYNIFAENMKIDILSRMSPDDKDSLIEDTKRIINDYWNEGQVSTNLKFNKEFSNIDEQIMYLDNLLSFVDWTKIKYEYNPNKKPRVIFQWNIFYCELGHNIGSEKNKTRPVLILQDMRDYLDSGTVLIAPITTGVKAQYRHEIIIDATEKSKVRGIIDLSHIKSVSRARLDIFPKDRLLNEREYQRYYGDKEYVTVQTKVKNTLKILFNID